MCKRCWRFISMAVKVLDRILRRTFSRPTQRPPSELTPVRRGLWLQAPPLGLLWSSRNPLLGFRPFRLRPDGRRASLHRQLH